MRPHWPAVLFLVPFVAAIIMPLVGVLRRDLCRPLTIAVLAVTGAVSLLAAQEVLQHGSISYAFGGWAPPLGIEWRLDGLSALMMVVLSLLATVALIYAGPVYHQNLLAKPGPFHSLVLLLVSGLTGIVLAADLFNVFVFLEVASLSSYALVASPGGRAAMSAFRYLILGTIGASLYVLGVGYFYAATGTLNMADVARLVPTLTQSKALLTGLVLILVGLGIKMALVPLHGWLPDAYTDAPDAISPLIAPLVTKVALYAMVRIIYWVIGPALVVGPLPVTLFLGWVGAIATVAGAFLALSQHNLKRLFAYSGVSHIGLVVVGVTVGNLTGFAGGIFYLVTDAVMQATLFFVAGAVLHSFAVTEVADLVRLGNRMPWVLGALIVTALSMVGIPPTGGFFGKWFILLGALEGGNYVAVFSIIAATLITLAYFVRIIEKMVLQRTAGDAPPSKDLPWTMRLSMGVLSAIIMGLGLASDRLISLILEVAAPNGL